MLALEGENENVSFDEKYGSSAGACTPVAVDLSASGVKY